MDRCPPLAGRIDIDVYNEPLTQTADGTDVYLRDIWPSAQEVAEIVQGTVTRDMFSASYEDVFTGPEAWRAIDAPAPPRRRRSRSGSP